MLNKPKARKLPIAEIERRLKKGLLNALFDNFLASGALDPAGKTNEQIRKEVEALLLDFRRGGPPHLIVDHRSHLLAHARRFVRLEEYELAILVYATWFEHWINAVFHKRALHFGLTSKDIRLCIRQTGLYAKFVLFPVLLKLPRLAESHVRTVNRCSELRNGFVHYKFSQTADTSGPEEEEDIKMTIACEKTVRYLNNYERLHIFKGAKARVRHVASGESPDFGAAR
jgi:hypothetical protein